MTQTQLMNFNLATCHPNLHLTIKGMTSPGTYAQITCKPLPQMTAQKNKVPLYYDNARGQMTSEAERIPGE